jgi:hypothetical protein
MFDVKQTGWYSAGDDEDRRRRAALMGRKVQGGRDGTGGGEASDTGGSERLEERERVFSTLSELTRRVSMFEDSTICMSKALTEDKAVVCVSTAASLAAEVSRTSRFDVASAAWAAAEVVELVGVEEDA